MTAETARRKSVTDIPVQHGKHTLYVGTLGHRAWLIDRKNRIMMTGVPDIESAIEVCFAYCHEPLALQSLQGAKAKSELAKFKATLTDDEFGRLQDHAEKQLLKFAKTLTTPKKATATKRRETVAHVRKR